MDKEAHYYDSKNTCRGRAHWVMRNRKAWGLEHFIDALEYVGMESSRAGSKTCAPCQAVDAGNYNEKFAEKLGWVPPSKRMAQEGAKRNEADEKWRQAEAIRQQEKEEATKNGVLSAAGLQCLAVLDKPAVYKNGDGSSLTCRQRFELRRHYHPRESWKDTLTQVAQEGFAPAYSLGLFHKGRVDPDTTCLICGLEATTKDDSRLKQMANAAHWQEAAYVNEDDMKVRNERNPLVGHVVVANHEIKIDANHNEMIPKKSWFTGDELKVGGWRDPFRKSTVKAKEGTLGVIEAVDETTNTWRVRWCYDTEGAESKINAPPTAYTNADELDFYHSRKQQFGDLKIQLPKEEFVHLMLVKSSPGLYAPFESAEKRYDDVCNGKKWYGGAQAVQFAVAGSTHK